MRIDRHEAFDLCTSCLQRLDSLHTATARRDQILDDYDTGSLG